MSFDFQWEWEYEIVRSSNLTLDSLNDYGRKGWELTVIQESGLVREYYFKRPIVQGREEARQEDTFHRHLALTALTRAIVKELENTENQTESIMRRLVEPLHYFVRPNVHLDGHATLTNVQRVEWYAGQLLDLVHENKLWPLQSLLGSLDKFVPETL